MEPSMKSRTLGRLKCYHAVLPWDMKTWGLVLRRAEGKDGYPHVVLRLERGTGFVWLWGAIRGRSAGITWPAEVDALGLYPDDHRVLRLGSLVCLYVERRAGR